MSSLKYTQARVNAIFEANHSTVIEPVSYILFEYLFDEYKDKYLTEVYYIGKTRSITKDLLDVCDYFSRGYLFKEKNKPFTIMVAERYKKDAKKYLDSFFHYGKYGGTIKCLAKKMVVLKKRNVYIERTIPDAESIRMGRYEIYKEKKENEIDID